MGKKRNVFRESVSEKSQGAIEEDEFVELMSRADPSTLACQILILSTGIRQQNFETYIEQFQDEDGLDSVDLEQRENTLKKCIDWLDT